MPNIRKFSRMVAAGRWYSLNGSSVHKYTLYTTTLLVGRFMGIPLYSKKDCLHEGGGCAS